MGAKKKRISRTIPASIRRQVLLEAGHCCAIPTCQFPATHFAHIVPFGKVKEHREENIIALCPNHHDLFDNKKMIDRKSMQLYKQKLQFLNKRYTKYELRLLARLSDKPAVVADGEIQVMGLLKDGLVKNKKTFITQSIEAMDKKGNMVVEDEIVQSFAAVLTSKGKQFIRTWKSKAKEFEPLQ